MSGEIWKHKNVQNKQASQPRDGKWSKARDGYTHEAWYTLGRHTRLGPYKPPSPRVKRNYFEDRDSGAAGDAYSAAVGW